MNWKDIYMAVGIVAVFLVVAACVMWGFSAYASTAPECEEAYVLHKEAMDEHIEHGCPADETPVFHCSGGSAVGGCVPAGEAE